MKENSYQKALTILPYSGAVGRDGQGRINRVYTPAGCQGGAARYAIVQILRTTDGGGLTCACRTFAAGSDADSGEPCKSADSRYICYHVRAALMIVAADTSTEIRLHADRQWAERDLADERGRLMIVRAGNATGYAALFKRGNAVKGKGNAVKGKGNAVKGKGNATTTGKDERCCDCGGDLPTIQERANLECLSCSIKSTTLPRQETIY